MGILEITSYPKFKDISVNCHHSVKTKKQFYKVTLYFKQVFHTIFKFSHLSIIFTVQKISANNFLTLVCPVELKEIGNFFL